LSTVSCARRGSKSDAGDRGKSCASREGRRSIGVGSIDAFPYTIENTSRIRVGTAEADVAGWKSVGSDPTPMLRRPRHRDALHESREVLRERRALALAQRDRDAKLFEVLIARLAAEIDRAFIEEPVHVVFERARGESDHAFAHATQPVLRIQPI